MSAKPTNKQTIDKKPAANPTQSSWLPIEANLKKSEKSKLKVPAVFRKYLTLKDASNTANKFKGAVLGTDGHIYFIPQRAIPVHELNLENAKISTFGSIKENSKTTNLWTGASLGTDGNFYAFPTQAQSILKIDPKKKSTQQIEVGHGGFSGQVAAADGVIYGVPSHYPQVMVFNPTTSQTSYFGDFSDFKGHKWHGGVLAPNGKIYFVPSDHPQVLVVDPSTKTTKLLDQKFAGGFKWSTGALTANGKIYCAPVNAKQILEIDTNDDSATLVGPTLGGKGEKWSKAIVGPDGLIYFIPDFSRHLLVYNPAAQKLHRWKSESTDDAWAGAAYGFNNFIYTVPDSSDNIWRIEFAPRIKLDPSTLLSPYRNTY